MEIALSERQLNALAYKTAMIIEKRLAERMKKNELPEMVTTKEAAQILRITPARMRQIADRYPHTKTGDSQQAKLLFVRSALLQ